jgi:hypothetical protein
MDDFVAALSCLAFLIPPSIVLIAIIANKIGAFGMVRGISMAMQRASEKGRRERVASLRGAGDTCTLAKTVQALSQIRLCSGSATKQ